MKEDELYHIFDYFCMPFQDPEDAVDYVVRSRPELLKKYSRETLVMFFKDWSAEEMIDMYD